MSSTTHWLSTAFDRVGAFLPSLVAGLVILVVGYVLAVLLGRITRALLSRTGYDRLLAKLGLVEADQIPRREGARWTGKAVFWVVMIAAVMQAARVWNLTMIGDGIGRIVAYFPHLFAAALIFAAALYVGNWVRDRIAHREMAREGAGKRPLVGSLVRGGILVFGAFMALRELQIAPQIVTIAFGVMLAGIALAGALAFGLGSRDVAGQITQQWYDRRPRWNGSKQDVTSARPMP